MVLNFIFQYTIVLILLDWNKRKPTELNIFVAGSALMAVAFQHNLRNFGFSFHLNIT
jgi:hypothetical protein